MKALMRVHEMKGVRQDRIKEGCSLCLLRWEMGVKCMYINGVLLQVRVPYGPGNMYFWNT